MAKNRYYFLMVSLISFCVHVRASNGFGICSFLCISYFSSAAVRLGLGVRVSVHVRATLDVTGLGKDCFYLPSISNDIMTLILTPALTLISTPTLVLTLTLT